MRKTALAVLLSGLLLINQAPAQSYSGSCFDTCGSWLEGTEVGVDFLWWSTCANDLDYAIPFDGNPLGTGTTATGSYKYVDPSYKPGFRIWLGKENVWCNWDLWATYTWFKSSASSQVTPGAGQTLLSSFQHGGFNLGSLTLAYGNYSLNYQAFDVVFGQKLCASECHVFEPFIGIQGVKIQQKRDYRGRDSGDNFDATRWDSDTRALGLEIGSFYQWDLGCGFNFFGLASLSVLAGTDDANTHVFIDDVATNAINFGDKSCIAVPGIHLAAGFSYIHDFCGKDVSLRIGYEFTDWLNVTRARRFVGGGSDLAISSSPKSANLVLHGLFLGLGVGF